VTTRIVLILVLIACISCGKKQPFEQQARIKIQEFQDRRETDSLRSFLRSSDIEENKAAAIAMASVQDTSAIRDLTGLLDEQIPEAAFALGQMYNNKAAKPLLPHVHDKNIEVVREAYEALGKVMQRENLYVFSEETTDSTALAGIAWGLYRAGVRGVSDSASVKVAMSIVTNKNAGRSARLGVAQFFSRAPFQQQPQIAGALKIAAQDADPEVRMAAVNALSKVKEELAIDAVAKAITDTDYRVRVNAARALRPQPWDVAKPLFEKLLGDENPHVNVAAAEVITNVAPAKDTTALLAWARAAKDWRTQATLYETLSKLLKDVNEEVKAVYTESGNDYQKAALITALSQGKSNVDFIFDQYKSSEVKVIRSTAAAALARINKKDAPNSSKYVAIYTEIIKDGDQGSLIPVCGALRDSTLGFKKIIKDYSFLEEAKSKLSLPRDYETYVPLEQTLNYFKGVPPPAPLENKYNHPIDWTVASSIAKDQHVIIETSKGEIVMRLFIDEAPGSVVNFVNLVNGGYFDGRFFHRVVPNFVIQTGCNRGDGFGSEDYSIRSEFSRRRYKTGSVGMASAGKDTEGTQWFITHSPTPHLDGKYTIFAEVVSGMDTVHKIQVGDRIISARLIEY